ncbi:Protein NETWORKED 2D, partial [Mucuna pruriens]
MESMSSLPHLKQIEKKGKHDLNTITKDQGKRDNTQEETTNMLQRAASNAYSWWWVSHIRTKQSKWMEQNLQDMEEKVQGVLKLLEEEGDSFAKRAEMYYKRRPELISFVEESFKAYRALAERYDHISTELQNANNTIASVYPDRVPFMDEDDDDASPRPQRKKPEGLKTNIPKPPLKDLKTVITTAAATTKFNSKKPAATAAAAAAAAAPKVPKSGLSRKEALEEVDKLQKQILSLQTVKEFVKNSYDNAIDRYWETEEQINELQERVSVLQDELGEGVVIDDDEARHLMAEAALKSCQEALTQLQEKQERSLAETRIESKRVKDVKAKLGSLMDEFHYDQTNSKEPRVKRDLKEIAETRDLEEDANELTQQKQDLQLLKENIKEHFETSSNSSLSVADMADKIDELVNKVISLETAVSSQTALVKRLRSDTDELQEQIRTLENDKESLIKDKIKLNGQLREMEERLHGVQNLNQIIEDQNSNLQIQFTEAHCNLDHLSEKVQNVQPGEEAKITDLSHTQKDSSTQAESKCESEGQVPLNQDNKLLNDSEAEKKLRAGLVEDDAKDKELMVAGTVEDDVRSDNKPEVTGSPFASEPNVTGSLENDVKVTSSVETEVVTPVENKSPKQLEEQEKTVNGDEKATVVLSTTTENQEVSQQPASNKADSASESFENDAKQSPCGKENALKVDPKEQATAKEDEPDWQQLFTKGMQDREQVLLTEYTNTLRSYRDVKKRLVEIEKKNQDSNVDSSLQLKELKTANAMKDEEIRHLRQKLDLLHRSLEGNEDLAESTLVPSEICSIEPPESTSPIEEKFRSNMDEILEENLTFWLKFSAYFSEIQKFETTIKDLQIELSKLERKGMLSEGNTNIMYSIRSDAKPIYKHLTEIQTEITVWIEKGALLKEELQRRFSSLCDIQEEITAALKASAEGDDFRFTSYQAAKFQGEILNMKQENNKVADELQAGLDIVACIQVEVEKALVKLNDEHGFSASKRQQNGHLRQSENRAKVPLRSFIFGTKPKKQSIFSCMTPGMHRKHRASKEQSHTSLCHANKYATYERSLAFHWRQGNKTIVFKSSDKTWCSSTVASKHSPMPSAKEDGKRISYLHLPFLASCGNCTPMRLSKLEAGPGSPCWEEKESRKLFTKFTSTSTGEKSSSIICSDAFDIP